jgi:hypothetical protein
MNMLAMLALGKMLYGASQAAGMWGRWHTPAAKVVVLGIDRACFYCIEVCEQEFDNDEHQRANHLGLVAHDLGAVLEQALVQAKRGCLSVVSMS